MSTLELRSEADRLSELEDLLAGDFDTFREVRIDNGRIDLLVVPTIGELDVVLAFEVKGDGYHLERALKQSADYVGSRVLDGLHAGKRIAACLLYPTPNPNPRHGEDRYHAGMFQLVAQWRVGRAYIASFGLTLAIGQETIWDARRGWHETVATRMLLSRRTVGGTRREFNRVRLDIKPILPRPVFTRRI